MFIQTQLQRLQLATPQANISSQQNTRTSKDQTYLQTLQYEYSIMGIMSLIGIMGLIPLQRSLRVFQSISFKSVIVSTKTYKQLSCVVLAIRIEYMSTIYRLLVVASFEACASPGCLSIMAACFGACSADSLAATAGFDACSAHDAASASDSLPDASAAVRAA